MPAAQVTKSHGPGPSCKLPFLGLQTALVLMLYLWGVDAGSSSSSVFGDWPPPHTVHVPNGGGALGAAAATRKRYSKGEIASMRQPPGANDFFTTQSFFSHTAKCFSCMSKFYEAVWPALASVYKRPMNFTDKCNEDILEARSVPVSHCPTICVGMWEEITVGGVKIRGHIRGCMDDLLHNGFNQTIVAWYRWMARDSCREYRKRELFKLPVTQSDESSIHLCTCYADHCNHAASPSAAASNLQGATTTSLVCLAALLLLTLQHLLNYITCPTSHDYILECGAYPRLDLHPNLVCQYDNEAKTTRAQPMDSWQKRKRRKAAM